MTADPEWTGWLKVGKNDSHLIIASDGVFEKMTTQEVCGVVSATKSGIDVSAALGLMSPARERPIALLPSRQRAKESQSVKEIQPSRLAILLLFFLLQSKSLSYETLIAVTGLKQGVSF